MQPNKYLVFTPWPVPDVQAGDYVRWAGSKKKKIFEGSTTNKRILILITILPRNPRKKYK